METCHHKADRETPLLKKALEPAMPIDLQSLWCQPWEALIVRLA
jgi:hypothetical protein